jgi:DNA adenine methylase
MQPIIRWAGSKKQLLHKLRSFWRESMGRYIEPFCGSACLFFDIEPKEAILADLNGELITTYRALKADAPLVCECVRRLPHGKGAYYKIRSLDPKPLSDAETAARFLYLNRHCFNGIYRTNQSGKFNVPFGQPKALGSLDYQRILDASNILRRAVLLNCDFQSTINWVRSGDFVYLDPPYALERRRVFAEYHPDAFATADLNRLSSGMTEIHQRGATFVVSYADCREARELLAPWKPKRVRTRRHIAGFADSRRSAYEIIASNSKEHTYVQ